MRVPKRALEIEKELKVLEEERVLIQTGRKRIGETKKVSITLPHGAWELVERARGSSPQSEYLRELILKDLKERGL